MSTLRRQTIISSVLIYIGFAFGALNTYLFTKEGIFSSEQYGLTRAFVVIGQFFYGFAGFGLSSVIYKFYPYYKDNLPKIKNDLLTLCLVTAFVGFAITTAGGLIFEPLVVKKFIAKSPLIVRYYYWVFPFTFFLLFFSILEAYAWSIGKNIIPNFLREAGFRISTTLLIVVFVLTGKNFELFIKLFSLLYAVSFFSLLVYLVKLHQFHIVREISRVTRKFLKKILALMAYVYGGTIVNVVAQSVDFLAIASFRGLALGAVFDFSTYLASVIQVPQRSLVAASIPVLSRAWKEKKLDTIDRIYKRSSLNLLLISTFIFSLIFLNYDDAVVALNLKPEFAAGKWVVFVLGLKNIIDMGTGVNGQIIGTSVYWRFDFFSGVVLLLIIIPLNIWLVKEFGIMGAAWSNLAAYIVYNTLRIAFLHKRFGLQPFTSQTGITLAHNVGVFLVVYLLFRDADGWMGMIMRSVTFVALFVPSAFWLKLSPDLEPVWQSIKYRLRIRR